MCVCVCVSVCLSVSAQTSSDDTGARQSDNSTTSTELCHFSTGRCKARREDKTRVHVCITNTHTHTRARTPTPTHPHTPSLCVQLTVATHLDSYGVLLYRDNRCVLHVVAITQCCSLATQDSPILSIVPSTVCTVPFTSVCRLAAASIGRDANGTCVARGELSSWNL